MTVTNPAMRIPMPSRLLPLAAVWLCLIMSPTCAVVAQDADSEHPSNQRDIPLQPISGRFYYVIEDLRAGRILRRGVEEANGDIHKGLLLPANRRIREGFVHAKTLKYGFSEFTTPAAGRTFRFPRTIFFDTQKDELDTDGDGLSDSAEFIVGTDSTKADTDGDGLKDGVEVQQGTNPLDETPGIVGPLAQVKVNGSALDVDALNSLVAVAAGDRGIALFNVGLGFTPTLLTQIDTPGDARRVSLTLDFAAAADGAAGLAVISLGAADLKASLRQIKLGESSSETATAVTSAGNFALVGTAEGSIFVVNLSTGAVFSREDVSEPVQDLKLADDLLLAVTHRGGPFALRTLHLFRVDGLQLTKTATLGLGTFGPEGLTASSRVSAGNGLAYVTAFVGFDVVDISNPEKPLILAPARDTAPNSFKQIVPNGSGLGLATVGIIPGQPSGHDLWVYDLQKPTNNTALLNVIPMPGRARAVALFNGLAYVAASEAGLQVVSYQSLDTGARAPSISLSGSFPITDKTGRAEEGKLVRVTAAVTDDAQVRQVQFFVNEQRLATDGNFPFELHFTTPVRTADRKAFTLRAVAVDTGGNATSTSTIIVELVPDATPPIVTLRQPAPGSFNFATVTAISAAFDEPVNVITVPLARFELVRAGADGVLGNADDVAITGGVLEYQPEGRLLSRLFDKPLPTDAYEARLLPPVPDLAGNSLKTMVTWRFIVANPNENGGVDTDGDGIPDHLERLLGLNPADAKDAQRDLDGDGLGTFFEIQNGLNPLLRDTDSNGLDDGKDDLDHDGLSNLREAQLGTNPRLADTDGDRWPDEAEVTAGSDPLRAASVPLLTFMGLPAVEVIAPRGVFGPGFGLGPTLALPIVEALAPRAVFDSSIVLGSILANPPLEIIAPRMDSTSGAGLGPTLANPPLEVMAPRAAFGSEMALGVTLASPPIEVITPRGEFNAGLFLSPTLGLPPVTIHFLPLPQ